MGVLRTFAQTFLTKTRIFMKKNELKKFFQFLKENNAYEAYKVNIINSLGYYLVSNWLKAVCASNAIVHAFSWAETKQGALFWDDIHLKWLDNTHNGYVHSIHSK